MPCCQTKLPHGCSRQKHRLTKNDELVLQCDEERTQGSNLRLAFAACSSLSITRFVPKEHVTRQDTEPPARVGRRLKQKSMHSKKKQRA